MFFVAILVLDELFDESVGMRLRETLGPYLPVCAVLAVEFDEVARDENYGEHAGFKAFRHQSAQAFSTLAVMAEPRVGSKQLSHCVDIAAFQRCGVPVG